MKTTTWHLSVSFIFGLQISMVFWFKQSFIFLFKEIYVHLLDMSEMQKVLEFAEGFKKKYKQLNVLVGPDKALTLSLLAGGSMQLRGLERSACDQKVTSSNSRAGSVTTGCFSKILNSRDSDSAFSVVCCFSQCLWNNWIIILVQHPAAHTH